MSTRLPAANVASSLARSRSHWVIAAGSRYWPRGEARLIESLPFSAVSWQPTRCCVRVALPPWAADLGVGHPPSLLVDAASIAPGEGSEFERCNWLAAAFLFLSGAQEDGNRVASYSALLGRIDAQVFERAWVNRIFLLLRRLAARRAAKSEHELFGPLPRAEFDLTHDVDAVRKTPEIRTKQSIFHAYNAARSAMRGEWGRARDKAAHAFRFAGSTPDYWTFPRLRALEAEYGARSTFHFYGGPAGFRRGSPRRMLLDPAYDVGSSEIRRELDLLLQGGWSVGVHPSFESWADAATMARERARVERACGVAVTRCRQHWLRFSWSETWAAQAEAGFTLDTTLGFNDRPAFRQGAALRYAPWDFARERPHTIEMMPMIFMDSHFYDYAVLDGRSRRATMAYWIEEVRAVGGQASINWHTHTLAEDYGWAEGYRDLLELLQ
jgi:hypothetical protein